MGWGVGEEGRGDVRFEANGEEDRDGILPLWKILWDAIFCGMMEQSRVLGPSVSRFYYFSFFGRCGREGADARIERR